MFDNPEGSMTFVFIDLDGTLIDGESSERLFVRALFRDRIAGPRQLAAFALFPLRWSLKYGRHVWKKNKAYLHQLSADTIQRHAHRFVQEEIEPRMCPVMRARVQHHQGRGDQVVLLTGSLSCIAQEVGRVLGVQHTRATICKFDANGRYGRLPPDEHPFGTEKLHIAREICREHAVVLDECFAYADSEADIPLLEAAGHPVAVHPRPQLRILAETRRWEIID